jgi:hypothetical protein
VRKFGGGSIDSERGGLFLHAAGRRTHIPLWWWIGVRCPVRD